MPGNLRAEAADHSSHLAIQRELAEEKEISHRKIKKDRRREFGVRAAASGSGEALRAVRRGEQSNLLIF
jgi:hypothetical protein